MTEQAQAIPRPYGRQPTALRSLAEGVQHQLERQLRETGAIDNGVYAKAYWLRGGTGDDYGWADYQHAYLWIAPIVMSPKLCEQIEQLVKRIRGVIETGVGGDPPEKRNALRPFVWAVVDLAERRNVKNIDIACDVSPAAKSEGSR